MAEFLRHRQRSLTALSPHQGNRNVLIPKRKQVAPEPVALFGASWERGGGPNVEGINFAGEMDQPTIPDEALEPDNWTAFAETQQLVIQSITRVSPTRIYFNLQEVSITGDGLLRLAQDIPGIRAGNWRVS